MPQQVNLYSPIFLAPQRHFSARAMVQALGVWSLALLALCTWVRIGTTTLQQELEGTMRAHAAERAQLQAGVAQRAHDGNATALEQELAKLRSDLARRRRTLDELTQGLALEGRSHAAILRRVAETVPPPVWLTELKIVDGRLELSGLTLQPEALQPWLARLSADPAAGGPALAAVKVERGGSAGSAGASAAQSNAWSFAVVSERPSGPTLLAGRAGARDGAAR